LELSISKIECLMQLDVDEESTPPHSPLKKKGEITINEPFFFFG
jgi:hypothetical protein